MFAHPQLPHSRPQQPLRLASDTELALLTPELSQDASRQMRPKTPFVRTTEGQYSNVKASNDRRRQENGTNDQPHHRGWRKVVGAALILIAVVLLLNLSFTIVLMTKFGAKDGLGLIYQGNCDVVKRWNIILHLLINVLGTLTLGASNYAMQCLSAPSRTEVDVAHTKGISLEIGVLSIRNFLHMRPMKGVLWISLCLSTLPLSFLWNSTIFTTGAANSSSYLIVDESFLSGSPFQQPIYKSRYCGNHTYLDPPSVASFMYDRYRSGKYVNISARECFTTYNNGDGSRFRNLILVTKPTTGMNMSYCGYQSQSWNGSSVIAIHNQLTQGSNWPLQSMDISLFPYDSRTSDLKANITQELQRSNIWHFGRYPIDYCFAEEYAAPCKLQFASFILYTVVICNFIKLVCLSATAFYLWDPKEPILATVGDAASSFLDKRDETTVGLCLLDHTRLDKHLRQQPSVHDYHNKSLFWKNRLFRRPIQLKYDRYQTVLLHNAEPRLRKWVTIGFGFTVWCGGLVAFFSTTGVQDRSLNSGFGVVSQHALLSNHGDSVSKLFADILIANSFQVVFSTVYVLYNATITARWGALEWASYSQPNLKPLRVTWPCGQQRSTYFLQLPWKYGIPFTILQMLMHFFISQSIFLARLAYYDTFGNLTDGGFLTVGYSFGAALTTFVCWTLVCIAMLGSGLLGLDNRVPIHGNMSAVISALCYTDTNGWSRNLNSPDPDDGGDNRLSTKLLMWGVTKEPGKPLEYYGGSGGAASGHCTFSDKVVKLPKKGLRYS